MEPAVALLIFLAAAAATVVISLVVQQHSSKMSTHLADPRQRHEAGDGRPSEDAGRDPTLRDEDEDEHSDDGRSTRDTREEELREARAEQLEAVADRERRYAEHAEHAEADARRLREQDDDGLGKAPNEQRARRAGIATDDLDY